MSYSQFHLICVVFIRPKDNLAVCETYVSINVSLIHVSGMLNNLGKFFSVLDNLRAKIIIKAIALVTNQDFETNMAILTLLSHK